MRRDRLKPLGITNMHASVGGMPSLDRESSSSVAEHIIKMQGHMKSSKLRDQWLGSVLKVLRRPVHMKTIRPEF